MVEAAREGIDAARFSRGATMRETAFARDGSARDTVTANERIVMVRMSKRVQQHVFNVFAEESRFFWIFRKNVRGK